MISCEIRARLSPWWLHGSYPVGRDVIISNFSGGRIKKVEEPKKALNFFFEEPKSVLRTLELCQVTPGGQPLFSRGKLDVHVDSSYNFICSFCNCLQFANSWGENDPYPSQITSLPVGILCRMHLAQIIRILSD